MNPKRFTLFHLVVATLLGSVLTFVALTAALHMATGPQFIPILQGMSLIRSRFVGDYDPDEVANAALNGMVSGLGDRWSHYLSPEEAEYQAQRRENSFCGIGIQADLRSTDGIRVLKVYDDSPAQRGGLAVGELITAVDGQLFTGSNHQTLVDAISGEEGTDVMLTVRAADGTDRELSLVRGQVKIDPVRFELLDSGVGYIALANFYSSSSEKLNAAVDELVADGATALVFDMRSNGGGYVPELTRMLDHLLPEGPIFRSVNVDGEEVVTPSDAAHVDLPMAVLVNKDTYSAAEFFAAQLQEAAGAYIVGEPTSGKGYSQQPLPLSNGGVMQISTGRYLTGKGVSLIGTGLTLDREVYLPDPLPEDPADFVDTQLNAALALLGYPPAQATDSAN